MNVIIYHFRFAPCDDLDDRTNYFRWLKLLYTSYISILNQAEKGRVFYSVDICFSETGADPRNFLFIGILPRDLVRDFRVEFESSRHRAIFEISSRCGEPP